MTQNDSYGFGKGYALVHIAESEMAEIHECFSKLFRHFGLTGEALDCANAACFRVATVEIQAHRRGELM